MAIVSRHDMSVVRAAHKLSDREACGSRLRILTMNLKKNFALLLLVLPYTAFAAELFPVAEKVLLQKLLKDYQIHLALRQEQRAAKEALVANRGRKIIEVIKTETLTTCSYPICNRKAKL